MNGKRKGTRGFNVASVIKCLLIGILGSILLIASYIVLELFWAGLIVYNEGLRNLYFGQLALLISLIPVFMGTLAAWSVSSHKVRFNGNVLAGLISGIAGSLGFAIALSVFLFTLDVSGKGLLGWSAIHDTVISVLTTDMPGLLSDVPVSLMFAMLSTMLSAIGGGIYFVLSYYARKGALRKTGLSGDARVITYLAVIMLAIILAFPALTFAGTQTGLIANQGFIYPVTVQRISDDTILFTNNGGAAISSIDPGSPIIVYIRAGGTFVKDITDQKAATEDGLNVTLEPQGGLGLAKGSALKVKGQSIIDLSYTDEASDKKMVHVMVIGVTTDGQKLVLLDKAV